ncbi:DEAD/DEAH box helicase [Candidatus Woesearchaeota archaeon]|nr:DEAD/DEAH box helicase [Candidatus Woesearchaeota archaeon]
MEFRGLTLDRFQVEAIDFVDKHFSVVVSAATGTGKTLIADYVIDRSFKRGQKVFYTSPIKALSNQKFREFKSIYGEDAVGILTGDVVINPNAPLLIMTTEIYRNMLLAEDPITDDLNAVIFDEIHYLGDIERGTIWEESIIFSPNHIRFLCLSATIPNAVEFAAWIESIQKNEVKVVVENKRAVPLEHGFFDNRYGISSLDEIRKRKKQGMYPDLRKGRGRRKRRIPETSMRKLTHIDLIKWLKNKGRLPCIYFCFNRLRTEEKAAAIADRIDFIPGKRAEAKKLIGSFMDDMDEGIKKLKTTRTLIRCLERGVGFHHAGILPVLKELVERFFAEGLLSLLYATETFAVGINLPAKTVCFDSLEKYDGIQFRHLKSKEYFQCGGRAGRRGMDKVGYVYTYMDPEFADMEQISRITASDSEPLESQYRLSYNTILNMIATHSPKERELILKKSLFAYQTAGSNAEILEEYHKRVAKLQELEYLDGDKLTGKGRFARKIYQYELILTELFTTTITNDLTDLQICLILGSLEFEPRPRITFVQKPTPASNSLMELFKPYHEIFRFFKKSQMRKLEPMVSTWYNGGEFAHLLDLTTMPEGDIIRFFRRIIDILQQIIKATEDDKLRDSVRRCLKEIDRDIIEVRL